MTNGLLTTEILFSCQIITQRHLDAVLPGAFQNTVSHFARNLSLSDFFSFPFPVSRTVKLGDEVAKSVSQ